MSAATTNWRDPVGLSASAPSRPPLYLPETLVFSLALSRAPLAKGVLQRSGEYLQARVPYAAPSAAEGKAGGCGAESGRHARRLGPAPGCGMVP